MSTIVDVGCTATRYGLTEIQKSVVGFYLSSIEGDERWLHHGDCIGGDSDICKIARDIGYKLESHPPVCWDLRASIPSHIVNPARKYSERNMDIVIASLILIACPQDSTRQKRGGTWMTVGFAEAEKKAVWLVWPDGRVSMTVGKKGQTK